VFNFLKKFLKKDTGQAPPVASNGGQTAPLSEDQLSAVSTSSIVHQPPQVLVGTAQSVGMQRENNEDSLFAVNLIISDSVSQLPFGLFIMADGMGGYLHGEVASRAAVRAFSDFINRKLMPSIISIDSGPLNESLQELMEEGVRESQQAVLRRAPGGGTTLTAALLLGEQVTLAHVGDSRGYFIYPDGRIQLMTNDHSLVKRLVDLGQLTEEQAHNYPQKNVLYRALGQLDPFKPDILSHMMPHPGYMVLCSDGLWGVIPDADIFKIVTSAANPSEACQTLVDAANAAGGPDNISVIVVQYLN
jgi:PPM family protein phosphatase